jgi:hypothetical protein
VPNAAEENVAAFERWVGAGLPAAVREWFVTDGPGRIAAGQDNVLTGHDELVRLGPTGPGGRYLPLERDSQDCCAWVVPLDEGDDPPVYLVDPDADTDDAIDATRTRYVDRFTAYTRVKAWDVALFAAARESGGDFEFDTALPAGALGRLSERLVALPTTYGWAGNQTCDAMYRFDGAARIAVAVQGDVALWSVVASGDPALRTELRTLLTA